MRPAPRPAARDARKQMIPIRRGCYAFATTVQGKPVSERASSLRRRIAGAILFMHCLRRPGAKQKSAPRESSALQERATRFPHTAVRRSMPTDLPSYVGQNRQAAVEQLTVVVSATEAPPERAFCHSCHSHSQQRTMPADWARQCWTCQAIGKPARRVVGTPAG